MKLHNIEFPKPSRAYTDAVKDLEDAEKTIVRLGGDIDSAYDRQDKAQKVISGLVQERSDLIRKQALSGAVSDLGELEGRISAEQAIFDTNYERANQLEEIRDELHATMKSKRERVVATKQAYFRSVLKANEAELIERARLAIAPLGALQAASGMAVSPLWWWDKARHGLPGQADFHMCRLAASELEQALS